MEYLFAGVERGILLQFLMTDGLVLIGVFRTAKGRHREERNQVSRHYMILFSLHR
jgi:hypothetical protein